MTREEAIKVIESLKQSKDGGVFVNLNEALDMAIEALSQPIVAKHFEIQSDYIYCSPQMVGREVDYNDYCSYGERQCNYFGERREE